MSENKSYTAASIEILRGLDGVKKRPSMYLGSTGPEGHQHMLEEIIDNSLDEAVAGHCKNIEVTIHKDGSATVKDDGRGIPVDKHPTEKIPAVDVVFTMLHAGGKFNRDNYKVAGGLHGVGASVVNALSEWVDVVIRRDGHEYHRRYEGSVPTKAAVDVVKKVGARDTGTTVRFLPDNKKYFKNCSFSKSVIARRLRELAFLNPGLTIKLTWEEDNTIQEFHSKGGLSEYVKYLIGAKKMLHEPICLVSKDINSCTIEVAFAYDSEYEETVKSFCNNIPTIEGGVHQNAALDSITKVITSIAESSGMMKGLEGIGVNKSDVTEGLTLIVSAMVPEPQFGGQTKTKLGNVELREPFGDWLLGAIEKALKSDKAVANLIAAKIIDAIKARDAARKAKNLSRKKSTLESLTLPGKLLDCTSKNPELCELFICEGNSAAGSGINARDKNFQAILPLRGKVLNVGKTTLNKALENAEIASIVSAIGVRFDGKEIHLDGLRYHKIIFTCDADSDGGHITCLLLTLFHKYMRKVIDEGHLYVCDLPLFRVKIGTKTHYIKDEEELEDFKKAHANSKMEISRFKGLGEMNADELRETAMSPKTRRLKRIFIQDSVEAVKAFECMMGEGIEDRKALLNTELRFGDEA